MSADEEDEVFLELRLEGRNVFTAAEAVEIQTWLGSRGEDDREILGFVLSDWTQTPSRFSADDFAELQRLGFVEVR